MYCKFQTCTVHIRHFFVKDRIDKKEMQVLYCLTSKMLADFITKPLQGELLYSYKRIVMGIDSIYDVINVNG